MLTEMLDHLFGRVALDHSALVEFAAQAAQAAPRSNKRDGQTVVSVAPTPGVDRAYVVIELVRFEQPLVEAVGNAMASDSVFIEVLRHCIACVGLGPIALAETTSKTNQSVGAKAQGDYHIAIRIRSFGEEGHRRRLLPKWAHLIGLHCHPLLTLVRCIDNATARSYPAHGGGTVQGVDTLEEHRQADGMRGDDINAGGSAGRYSLLARRAAKRDLVQDRDSDWGRFPDLPG